MKSWAPDGVEYIYKDPDPLGDSCSMQRDSEAALGHRSRAAIFTIIREARDANNACRLNSTRATASLVSTRVAPALRVQRSLPPYTAREPLTAHRISVSLTRLKYDRQGRDECLRQQSQPEHDGCGDTRKWRFRRSVRRLSFRRCVPVGVSTGMKPSESAQQAMPVVGICLAALPIQRTQVAGTCSGAVRVLFVSSSE